MKRYWRPSSLAQSYDIDTNDLGYEILQLMLEDPGRRWSITSLMRELSYPRTWHEEFDSVLSRLETKGYVV